MEYTFFKYFSYLPNPKKDKLIREIMLCVAEFFRARCVWKIAIV